MCSKAGDAAGGTGRAHIDIDRQAIALFDDIIDVREFDCRAWIDASTADPAVKARLVAMLEADRISSLGSGGQLVHFLNAPIT